MVATAGAKRGEETSSAPPGPLGGPREVKGVEQRPGTVRQERGGGVVVVVRVDVGVTVLVREFVGVAVLVREDVGIAVKVEDVVLVRDAVGERDGVGEGEEVAVPQPPALPTPSAKPVLGGQGSGSVLLAGQYEPKGQRLQDEAPPVAEKLPAAQGVGLVLPGRQNVPGGHCSKSVGVSQTKP